MPAEVFWSALAREELLDLYVTIGLENPEAAERTHPGLVRQAPHAFLDAGVHAVPDTDVGPVNVVEIINIVHGRRDLSGVVQRREVPDR